ncbi:MAG TPA: 2-amino-4-hydroxy-6-hydroxymethyldihydropteridine diphosphokinase [Cycloclasticus sp.]|jgi:2-amino-4-hydroxy-6-hydroxymethyldihydropteridine diphosphokinase|nr:2-amino-4-hydroxy-6-hydroxymethyldihydropteridine diphosphokinase [Cycloclasticus sp.]HIL93197.1 2-amino-4-hydroxy-6-hydroxymethyldihydropteridine diphosphokinase [Cycloclasticus sp.]
MPASVFIGLGSNLSSPIQQVLQAINEIAGLANTKLNASSSLYETAPMGPQDQPNYINAVVHIHTSQQPLALLKSLQKIEQLHSRTRNTDHWGARTLDLDILHVEGCSSNTTELTLPHPGLHCRSFVLYPLHEISPHLDIPNLGSIEQLIVQLNEPKPTIISGKNLEKPPSVC